MGEEDNETKVLSMLREDGRMKLRDIARNTHIQFNTVSRIVNTNKNIIKHTTILDFKKLGYQIRLILALSVQTKHRDAIEEYLKRSPCVNSAMRINNGYNFMCELYFKDFEESNRYLENLENRFHIFNKDEYYILDSIVEHKFMTNPNLV